MPVPSEPLIEIRPRASDGAISFWWQPPISDGGYQLTGYLLQCTSPDVSGTYGPYVNNATITGLTNGVSYAFTLAATNGYGGYGPAASFRVVQPGPQPGQPLNPAVVRITDGVASVNWSPPANAGATGTSDIGWYVVSAKPLDASGTVIQRSTHGYELSRYFDTLNHTTTYNMLVQAVNDTAYSPPTAYTSPLTFGFVPSDISGLTLWLDAADQTTMFQDASGIIPAIFEEHPVVVWKDKSPKHHDFSVFDYVSAPPTFTLKGYNYTFPSVNFNGIDISGQGLEASGVLLTETNTVTQFYVFQVPYINFPDVFPIFIDASENNWLAYQCFPGLNAPSSIFGYLDVSGGPIAFDGSFNMVPIVVSQYADLSNSYIYSVCPAYYDASGQRYGNPLNVRQNFLFGAPFYTAAKMYMAEMLHYDGVLSAVERDTVEQYLTYKWGLAQTVLLDGEGTDLSGGYFYTSATLSKPTNYVILELINVLNIERTDFIWVSLSNINPYNNYTGTRLKIDHTDANLDQASPVDFYIDTQTSGPRPPLPLVPGSKITLIFPRAVRRMNFGINND
jgi:hypothetical protein